MTATELGAAELAAWVRRACTLITEHADELTALDAAIGDADHGANMRRGMTAAVEAVEADTLDSPEAVLKKVAMTLISKVGGASGPLYGTFFLRMSTSSKGNATLELGALTAAVEAGVVGIVQRGKAQAGEKTMLDAWYPALEALRGAADLPSGAEAAAQAAEAGRAATEPMLATKGRASYLGERSIGHIDPGAASTALIVRALADVVSGDTK
ncbi:PTS-dependent dihydroxyacetone kinase, ADP-binding subunit dhaL [Actinomyces bovis]|uniref:PTS-dependent dihydroxyacetone kinase, ADP-binding subunit dhaL n=1 Tax=Actinomyces bovis TaxID=1658 RepID=A0ABY1VSL7_9ACTO|nr:dihydroxyacetone kinase subunit DhaL [Actinomyces bovis]SPT54028.1 PTS-dependent dihydroxyacetone kinase, ADP-binding subunit dhaL [Actinomyces bovis]VEG53825.1 PTS-dependent dihydroxyacetone kinase, ADP-binding subunit dhaL [Actinomyces israelii]